MEARYGSLALLALVYFSFGANYTSRNFVVTAPSPQLAKQIANRAEEYRKELALFWLGRELPDWRQPCPISVRIGAHAGGETSFAFVPTPNGTSQPVDWRMKIFGPTDRLMDSVLPHEVTHTIFATHFGRPLPRWADEGACTTVEHNSERAKNHRMLLEFLTTNRGIPFNHMFAMKQYPSDILPLYAQGYSLARFLIMHKGPKHFVDFVGEGMRREIPGREPVIWNQVTREFYGFKNLSDLQLQWLDWVRKRCPDLSQVAQNPAPRAMSTPDSLPRDSVAALPNPLTSNELSDESSWYLKQMDKAVIQRRSGTPAFESSDRGYQPGSAGGTLWQSPTNYSKTQWR